MENNLSNNTTKKTMDYANTFTKSIINQTENDLEIESNLERECNNLIKSAKRKIQPKCCLFCSPKYKRYEESCSLYKIAGDKYKSAHCWHKAAICYENCSLIKKRLQQNPLNYYEQAYYCYDKMDFSNDLKNIFDMMNSLLEKEGKFFQVGKNYENMGIKMEKKENYDIAIEYYLLAMKYYEKDFKHENIKTKLLIKLCELMILHNYSKAENYVPNMLENIGINCDTATSGVEALRTMEIQHAKHEPYNLVFVDWKMPDCNGLDVTREISRGYHDETKIIMLTAYSGDDVMDEAVAAGADGFITKSAFPSIAKSEIEKVMLRENKRRKHKTSLNGKHILLAEDMPINAEIIKQILALKGMDVVHAENGREALKAFESSEPGTFDTILMDVRMPEMDGLEATVAIRGLDREDAREIPIIALTANAFDEDVQRSLQVGMNAHLSKPVEPNQLYSTLEELID